MNSWPYSLGWWALAALLFTAFGWWLTGRFFPGRFSKRLAVLLQGVTALAAGALLTTAAFASWYYLRPQPAPVSEELFSGIHYVREVRRVPRPVVIHVVTVDLTRSGLEFLVTPGKPGEERPLTARTTGEFAREFKTQIALNGDFFSPWYANTPWDFYPQTGQPVSVHGVAASRGVVYTEGERKWDAPTLYLSKENRPSLVRPEGEIHNAISGNIFLWREGRKGPDPVPTSNSLEPRTAIGFDRQGTRLILVAVDGRQPRYSEGMNYDELIQLLADHGAYSAINLDGGGSTALVVERKPGKWELLNCPIHTRYPGRERPVGNHLGIKIGEGAR